MTFKSNTFIYRLFILQVFPPLKPVQSRPALKTVNPKELALPQLPQLPPESLLEDGPGEVKLVLPALPVAETSEEPSTKSIYLFDCICYISFKALKGIKEGFWVTSVICTCGSWQIALS